MQVEELRRVEGESRNRNIFGWKSEEKEKNKRYSYDAGYKVKVIPYAEEHGNRAAERHFGPPSTEKIIRDWRASKE